MYDTLTNAMTTIKLQYTRHDYFLQVHTTPFLILSSKLSVKAVQHSSQTAKLCSHCTIAARSCQLSQLGGRLFTQTNAMIIETT